MNLEQKEIFENRVTYQNKATENQCPNCDEPLVFALKDKYHEFSMGLSTVLQLLLVAEKQGYVPKLPSEWKVQILKEFYMVKRE